MKPGTSRKTLKSGEQNCREQKLKKSDMSADFAECAGGLHLGGGQAGAAVTICLSGGLDVPETSSDADAKGIEALQPNG
jgi:hypothetical protein